jgi:hypothetical protein
MQDRLGFQSELIGVTKVAVGKPAKKAETGHTIKAIGR